jgi:CHAT domain-containing protein
MKTIILSGFFCCCAFFISAQNPDALAVAQQVDSLIKISRSLTAKYDFDKALEVNSAAEKIALQKFSRESAAYGSACFNHGRISFCIDDFSEAEKWYLESKVIREKVLGKEHPDYAWSLNNLATLYERMGDYEKAEPLYLESKAIRGKVLGKEHPDYAGSLNNLAGLYHSMGEYKKTELLYLESKVIREKALGKEHYDYAASLINLSNLYKDMGDYEKAEPLSLESKAILEKLLGKEHPTYAMCLNNLAALYDNMGDYKKAELLYLESKVIREKVLGKEHPDYAGSLSNLAGLYLDRGNYEKAEPLYLESNAILEKVLGKEHPDNAMCLHNLASLYVNMGNYEKADQLHHDAKAIREKVLGKEHPDYAISLYYLAIRYEQMGNFKKAEPLYLESKAIDEKALGKEHPQYLNVIFQLAGLYWKMNRLSEASALLLEHIKVSRQRIANASRYISENELLKYLSLFEVSIATFQSFAEVHPSPELSGECFNNALVHTGLTLENDRILARAITEADSTTRSIYEKWQSCHRRLAKRYARAASEGKKIAEVEAEAEGYEKMLMRRLPAFQEARKAPQWQDVRARLKPGEAVVVFVHNQVHQPAPTDSIMYAALVLRPGLDAPKLIPLFEQKALDSLLQNHGERKADYVSSLYSIANRGIIATRKASRNMFELCWKPLEPALADAKTIYFSPTGLLHRINLGAVPFSADSVLADRYHLLELGNPREILSNASNQTYSNTALLFGGIQYEMDSTAIFAANARSISSSDLVTRGETPSFDVADGSRGGSWGYLSGTEKEVQSVAGILGADGFDVDTRKGFDATEEAFKTIGSNGPSPRILHIATHGFFFPDPRDTTKHKGGLNENEVGFKASQNPLIRSGLLLAGSNYAWATGKPLKKTMENGILTAYEICHLDLSNTELVVLSACETGLGDIQGNEGVYGLQRAFKIAGVKYLIMSLWQVPDKQTSLLMTTFYRKWLEENMTIPDAFHAAQKDLREMGFDPYQWAGFVLVE